MQEPQRAVAPHPDGPASTFKLPGALDLPATDGLHAALLARLRDGNDLVLDGGGVERVSTACLQVLVAARASAAVHGIGFRLQDMSVALAAAIRDLDLVHALGLEAAL